MSVLLFEDFTKLYKRWNGGELRKENKYEFVDLGLPSGTLWATCNVGSSDILDPGGFFAWGELKEKDVYSEETYNYYKKYLHKDFAKSLIGSDCGIPTKEDFEELYKYCSMKQINNYNDSGNNVVVFTPKNCRKKNKPTLIFPLSGYKMTSTVPVFGYKPMTNTLRMEGDVTLLWTINYSKEFGKATCIKIGLIDMEIKNIHTYWGCNLRPIKNKESQ